MNVDGCRLVTVTPLPRSRSARSNPVITCASFACR